MSLGELMEMGAVQEAVDAAISERAEEPPLLTLLLGQRREM